ncbi:hypothetical protein E2C01_092622 [Portunus trituberculatus]|uniref:Uncharacterized protein n=1 Tax=Portunus trituberculatus TaxID=210409 RepID=A0A5B7JGW9_PORTR|nr:hypothetical protein [Portunus trituberculatus]
MRWTRAPARTRSRSPT